MLNAFGKWLRKFRIDNGLLLRDMAGTLDVSSAFLSSIETGRKSIPDGIVGKICDRYRLDDEARISLNEAVKGSVSKVSLDLSEVNTEDRCLACAFAKRFPDLSPEDKVEILKILSKAGD